ncbi:MAG: 4,5-DOPA dioxygenase extradiol [Calditrichaceae bacterium]
MISKNILKDISEFDETGTKMPVLFIGHGSPMNAIDENEFSQAWSDTSKTIPAPKAILCISAHWQTNGTLVTSMEKPRTIHDFYGFPKALFDIQYSAPGSPTLAQITKDTVMTTDILPDNDWGLDHGTWSVLRRMYPKANIPVIQLSLDMTKGPDYHYELGKELKRLRRRGVLAIGSGNMVHNLGEVVWKDTAFDWAMEFDDKLKRLIASGDHKSVVNYQNLGRSARLSIPTNEHYLPLLYILGMSDEQDDLSFFTEKVTLGSMSMRSLKFG